MAEAIVLKNAYLAWSTSTGSAAADQIAGVKSITFSLEKAKLDNAVMGDVAEVFKQGLISAPISVKLRHDYTTGGAALGDFGVDKECWNRWNSEVNFKLKLRYVNSAVSASNPSYTFSRVGLFKYDPLNGEHGQLLENEVQFELLSGCAVSRSTST